MSSLLYRLGRAAYLAKGWVLVGWVLILALAGGLAGMFSGSFNDEFRLPGTQSQQALDQLGMTFPEVSGTSATVVVVLPEGHTMADPEVRARVEAGAADLGTLDFVETSTLPYDTNVAGLISADQRAGIIRVSIDGDPSTFPEENLTRLADKTRGLGTALAQLVPGSQVSLGGEVFGADVPEMSVTEMLGVGVALIVLVFTLGSLAAAAMPVLTAVVGVAISMALVLLSTGFLSVNSTTPMLAVMLGLAVGIDYALFILSRHREQLADGLDPLESAARAIATSGSAVVFAGLTVIIALVGLVVADIPFLTSMGLAAALAVAIAVLIALTALPALMGLAGERLRPRPSRRARPDKQPDLPDEPTPDRPRGLFARWVWLVTRVPAVTIVVVLVGLGALALPARDLQLALPDAGQDAPGSPTRVTYELLAEHFGPGFNGPLIVTAGIVGSDDPLGVMAGLKADIEKMPGVASVPMSTPNRGADTGIVQVVPTSGPQEQATKDLVYRLRAQAPHWRERYGVDTAVTGFTAVAIDVSDRLARALLPFGVFVVGLSLVLLAMVFRSVAVPIKATVGYLFSVLGAFGAVALVFEHGWFASLINLHQTGPVISFLPIILMGILFGLAMDYEVFLVARMREDHVHGESAREAVQTGFIGSGPVVLAAALIMFSVFAFFVPHGSANMKSIAFGLSVGVAIDAFVVRMTLVPAVMMLLGERAWWLPRWLDRRLPTFDVEGESLHRQLRLADWPAPDDPHVVYAEGLAVRAGHRDLFTGLDVKVLPGEVAVVEGERAARSALLLALSGRLRPDAGQARVSGLLLPERASAVRRRAGLVDLASGHAAAVVTRLLALDASRLPLILVDDADAAQSSADRAALADLVSDAAGSGRALVLAASDADLLADLLPARYLRVAATARPAPFRPDEMKVRA